MAVLWVVAPCASGSVPMFRRNLEAAMYNACVSETRAVAEMTVACVHPHSLDRVGSSSARFFL
jgi:hypothetical protein